MILLHEPFSAIINWSIYGVVHAVLAKLKTDEQHCFEVRRDFNIDFVSFIEKGHKC